jgi:ABC-type transport system involved in cytochrome bd biosynthesis fused ATPase/permease subunit
MSVGPLASLLIIGIFIFLFISLIVVVSQCEVSQRSLSNAIKQISDKEFDAESAASLKETEDKDPFSQLIQKYRGIEELGEFFVEFDRWQNLRALVIIASVILLISLFLAPIIFSRFK